MSNLDRKLDFRTEVVRTGRRMDGRIWGVPTPRSVAARLCRKVIYLDLIAARVAAATGASRLRALAAASMRRAAAGLLVVGVVAACLLVSGNESGAAVPQSRAVLIINQSTALRPWPAEVIAGIQSIMRVQPRGGISFYVEHLDLYRFDSPAYRESLQAYLGHKNIQHTVRYTELAPTRFKDFWRD